ncbi:helicase [Pleurotus pulmonarius]|nr:helicase [Pleurotus pulmonarius]KAF4599629.1 helicase [Pleurotus pulmonarius]
MPGFAPLLTGSKRHAPSDLPGQPAFKKAALDERCWMVQWRKPQTRKHKTWDGDAVLVVSGTRAILYDTDGKTIGSGKVDSDLSEGTPLQLAGKELEIDCPIPHSEYLFGACFGRSTAPMPQPVTRAQKPFKKLTTSNAAVTLVRDSSKPLSVPPASPKEAEVSPKATTSKESDAVSESHWVANWRKPKASSNKQTWDGDAYISQRSNLLTMISEDGKIMGTMTWKGSPLYAGLSFHFGGKVVQLDAQVTASQLPMTAETSHNENQPPPPEVPAPPQDEPKAAPSRFVVPSANFYGPAPKTKIVVPKHDPDAPGALLMKAPTKEHQSLFNKKNLTVVPVVLDPILARHLRPHQVEGVRFLYECVMSMRKHEGQGCILADEMGLGKTLQTITLVWTLLKQNPYGSGLPVVSNVLIVCPVSLINNWKAEFHKWLGRDRVGVVACDKPDKKVIKTFINTKTQQVLIIGYERLRTVIGELESCIPPIGLVICDEGHRLKSAKNKTVETLRRVKTLRRVILSGTPIQNDLGEFHAMADYCNPGLLDEYQSFRRIYEAPILKSREPDATSKEIEIGTARSEQLLAVAKSFVLRRDASILNNYLPPKHEFVVFVAPTKLQTSIFQKILNPDRVDSLMQGPTAESLALINMLTKISSSPILLKATADKAKMSGTSVASKSLEGALQLLPPNAEIEDLSLSGKLSALAQLLAILRLHTDEKIVLVSHYTSTLNILEAFCKKKRYSYYRLDGQTAATKRQEYVNAFNKSDAKSAFVFLLSSKAGGVGINLVGASRLCLVDSDWNPSHDLQSMARIHRDGQKRPVYIYRFLTTGAIDEKIYQRQVTKLGLSNAMMGNGAENSKSDSFSRKDLRDIFKIHFNTPCNTHDLLQCYCAGSGRRLLEQDVSSTDEIMSDDEEPSAQEGFVQASEIRMQPVADYDRKQLKEKEMQLAALGEWTHINCLRPSVQDDVQDDILRRILRKTKSRTDDHSANEQSRLDRLLHDTDLNNIAAVDEAITNVDLRELPGGTISFVFQKTSLLPQSSEESE